MGNNKALLIRVGIDTGSGGGLAPIYSDNSFEYIPIPEGVDSSEHRTYNSEKTSSGILFSDYLSKKHFNDKIHYDPEFSTYTYGDYKSKRLQSLEKNDMIIFYAGLKNKTKNGLYIIGYFTIKKVIHIKSNAFALDKNLVENNKCGENAHFKRWRDGGYFIAKGFNRKSTLLDKAILISSRYKDIRNRSYHGVSKKMENLLGIKGSIQRSVPVRTIEGKYFNNLCKLLNNK